MRVSSKESEQTQSARGMATRTRRQSQTPKIDLGYLNYTRYFLVRFTGASQCWFTEIIQPNDPRKSC